MKETITFEVSQKSAKKRLDAFCCEHVPDITRSRLQALIKEGNLQKEGVVFKKAAHKVCEGEVYILHLPLPVSSDVLAEDIPLEILYEDAHIIVLNKSAGLTVHPAAGNWTGTLVNALLHHCKDSLSGIGGVERPGIVHRLDKDTSGVMVVAKDDLSHVRLARQFEKRSIERTYLALCYGTPWPRRGEVNTFISRHPHNRKKMAVVEEEGGKGKHAITLFKVDELYADKLALIRCNLKSGRTHQIRVHMAHLKHPLVGDMVYGRARSVKELPEDLRTELRALKRQMLHATSLGFVHPITKENLFFEVDPPKDMQSILNKLRALA